MADYEAVFALWQAGAPGIEIRPSDGRSEVAKRCQRDRDLFLVAECQGRLVGVVMGGWDGRRGWIHHLAVAPDARGQGVAQALVIAVEDGMRAVGCLKVNLLVRQSNDAARRLYDRLGYGETPDMIVMGKELAPATGD
jgi:ribosomal protein S18 acetylase RimI-like enzyme